jgi:hypothetical protein
METALSLNSPVLGEVGQGVYDRYTVILPSTACQSLCIK